MKKSPLRVVQPKRLHARDIARAALKEYRAGNAIDRKYDFEAASRDLRQIVYNASVWFHCRKWYVRFLWWR